MSMAHKRKDTLAAPKERWKHLRPYYKRKLSKKERQAAKKQFTNVLIGISSLFVQEARGS